MKDQEETQNCPECGWPMDACDCLKNSAEAKNGDKWTGEYGDTQEWWVYRDKAGNLYESKEIPVHYIRMDNARLVTCENGSVAIGPK